MTLTALPERLPMLGLDGITLKHGGHTDRLAGVCLLEAVAWVAGEPHSDQPLCACPVMAAFGRAWNDAIRDDETRTRVLKPLVTLLVGSKSTPAVELQRSYLAFDWLARVQAPAWLDLTESLKPHAETLRALAPLTDKASVAAADKPLAAARDAARAAAGAAALAAARAAARDAARAAAWAAAGDVAWAAAGAAARDAARAAAWAAARDAARAAAGAAAWAAAGDVAWAAARDAARAAAWAAAGDVAWAAARDAARAAAGDVAWAAARDAARAAADKKLAPTVAMLQASAIDLFRRMAAIKE